MLAHINRDIPLVTICNISETFFAFLNRAEDAMTRANLIHGEQYRCDRTLLWLGDPKLVFATFPIPHADYFCQHFGYPNTYHLAPTEPSPFLSLDILRESRLINRLVEYAGAERIVQLVPYATTPQFFHLVESLQKDYQLKVLLPESPRPECLWLRDYIDTKAGFRLLASRWLPNATELLPPGFICQDLPQAAAVAHWFNLNDQNCLVKADRGEDSIGHLVFRPGEHPSAEDILPVLQHNTFLGNDWVTVEALISSSRLLSPSLELFVPPLGAGEPEITYLCGQYFLEFAGAHGIWISRELYETSWYPIFAESGLLIASKLQAKGYVGHFDIDAIVTDQDRVFLVEINARRTGGTHVHEFANFFFGPNYLDEVVLLGNDSMDSGAITQWDELRTAISDLLYPIGPEQRGVIVTVTSALEDHEFGAIMVAPSTEEVLALKQALEERIRNSSTVRQ